MPFAARSAASRLQLYAAVHPWLMSLRESLAEAKVYSPLCSPGPLAEALEARWTVVANRVPEVDVEAEDYRIKQFRPPLPMNEALREAMRQARAERLSRAAQGHSCYFALTERMDCIIGSVSKIRRRSQQAGLAGRGRTAPLPRRCAKKSGW